MKPSSVNYLVGQGLKSTWKNRMMSFASFCIILVSLLMVGISVLAAVNLNRIISGIEGKNEAVVQIKDGATKQQIDALGEQLRAVKNISKVEFYSRDQALEDMLDDYDDEEVKELFQYGKEQNESVTDASSDNGGLASDQSNSVSDSDIAAAESGTDKTDATGDSTAATVDSTAATDDSTASTDDSIAATAGTTDDAPNADAQISDDGNPLPDVYKISVSNIDNMELTTGQISAFDNVETVRSPTKFAEVLINIRNIVSLVSAAIILALIVVCLVIISNTTRTSVFARRKEISIMKYVGATNSFIKIPFFIEGMLIGVVAAGGALLLTKFAYEGVYDIMNSNVQLWSVLGVRSLYSFDKILLPVTIAYAAVGALIGAIGSTISTGKYVKV
ncbi:MAG: permease-like cell division protein FtsX [Oscillospiraceae bacterium]